MTTADDYINSVLDCMPRTMPKRSQIAMELRGHIAERIAAGQALDDVLRQLGDAAKLAESYLSAEPLLSAPFMSRVAAKIIDGLCVLAVICPVAWLVSRVVNPHWVPIALLWTVFFGGSVLFGVYTVVAELNAGRTFGKHLFDMRVVRESGARISLGQAIVRQLPMFLQFYWVDVLFALFTDRSQRAFEMLSKTRVVRSG
jgi:uncharacterized RDD family membrane protein YckC